MKAKLLPIVMLLCLAGHTQIMADDPPSAFSIYAQLDAVDATLATRTTQQLQLVTRVSIWKYRAYMGAAPNLALANQCEQVMGVVHQTLVAAAQISSRSRAVLSQLTAPELLTVQIITSLSMSAMQFADDANMLIATATTGMDWVHVQLVANGF